MIKTITITLALLLSWSISAALGAETQTNPAAGSDSQILFLQIHLEKGQMTVVKSTPVPGVLRTPRAMPGRQVMFALESTNGTALWSNSMDDPSLQRLEYPDASEPGVMRSMVRTNDPGDFFVRVPQISGADRLSFYRLKPAAVQSATLASGSPAASSQTAATTNEAVPVKELMGSVALPKNQ